MKTYSALTIGLLVGGLAGGFAPGFWNDHPGLGGSGNHAAGNHSRFGTVSDTARSKMPGKRIHAAKGEFQEDLVEIRKLRDPIQRAAKLQQFARTAARKFDYPALHAMAKWFPLDDGLVFLRAVMQELGTSSPAEAWNFAYAAPASPLRNDVLAAGLLELAKQNPTGAIRNAMEMLPENHANNALIDLARQWAQNDPHRALAWAASDADPSCRMLLLESMAHEWGGRDAEQAFAEIAKTLEGEMLSGTAAAIAAAWVQYDPEKAMAMAGGMDRTTGNQNVAQAALSNWAIHDPSAVVSYLKRNDGIPAISPEMATHVGRELATRSFEEAAEFASLLRDSATRDAVMAEALTTMSTYDPERALQAALAAPLGSSQRDQAAPNIMSQLLTNFSGGEEILKRYATGSNEAEIKRFIQNARNSGGEDVSVISE